MQQTFHFYGINHIELAQEYAIFLLSMIEKLKIHIASDRTFHLL